MRDHGNMFVARCIALFSDVLNNRLYERVRERGGLVYSVDLRYARVLVGLFSRINRSLLTLTHTFCGPQP